MSPTLESSELDSDELSESAPSGSTTDCSQSALHPFGDANFLDFISFAVQIPTTKGI